LKRID